MRPLPRKASHVVAGIIAALSALIRLPGLGSHWLNPDEGVHASIAALPTLAEVAAELPDHTDPPGFFLPLRLVALHTTEPAWLRLPSLCFGALAVLGVYAVGRRAFGTATGLVAAALLAVAPGEIALSQLVRQYTLQHALLAFALAALLGFLATGRRAALAAYALLLALALLPHSLRLRHAPRPRAPHPPLDCPLPRGGPALSRGSRADAAHRSPLAPPAPPHPASAPRAARGALLAALPRPPCGVGALRGDR